MTHHVAIVGGGPIATYALERLAALLSNARPAISLTIWVFERTGQFGAGSTHSATQAGTSYMNRVASQIGFAADESNADARHLLPAELRPNFYEWCQAAYQKTGDRRFDLQPGEVPRRYLHGLALVDMFGRFVAILRSIAGISVELRVDEVTDISLDRQGRFRLHLAKTAPDACPITVDHVLLATGHSTYRPAPGSWAARLARHASVAPPARYVRNAYPLARQLSEEVIPGGATIGMLGMGLTAIDALLHLTEGRGGRFVAGSPGACGLRLHYLPSGREPRAIVMASPSGMFTACRPSNQKAADGSARTHAAHEHKGRFLTVTALRTLRCNVGIPARLSHGIQRQLDFERHVFPLVVLEIGFLYYETLLGKTFACELEVAARAPYENFLRHACRNRDAGVADLLAPLQRCFDAAVRTLQDSASADSELHHAFMSFLSNQPATGTSRWEHSPLILAHRFDWRRLFWPLADSDAMSENTWPDHLTSYMRRDLLDADQGNLRNPVKAACEGVWRDLRAVFSELLDFGGLHADSQRQFMDSYFRLYTRMSNGAGVEPMVKLLALVEAGLVDVSVGPAARVKPAAGSPTFRITGARTGTVREVPILVDARVARFDARLDDAPLYRNLLKRGMVRLWVNPASGDGGEYVPGALDLDTSSHPIRADGRVDRRITLMGAAAEGVLTFQLSAARPRANSAIFNRLACWAQEVLAARAGTTIPARSEAACTRRHRPHRPSPRCARV